MRHFLLSIMPFLRGLCALAMDPSAVLHRWLILLKSDAFVHKLQEDQQENLETHFVVDNCNLFLALGKEENYDGGRNAEPGGDLRARLVVG